MRYQTQDGRELKIGVRYQDGVTTTIAVTFPGGTEFQGNAVCWGGDKFDRVKGLRIAIGRLFFMVPKTILGDGERALLVRRMLPSLFRKTPSAKVGRAAVAALQRIRDVRDGFANGTIVGTPSGQQFDDWAADLADSVLVRLNKRR